MPNIAIIPERTTRIEPLHGFVDGFTTTEHKLRSQIGESPLESGATIADHAVAEPIELSIEGLVTDIGPDNTPYRPERVEEAWQKIVALQEGNEIVEVLTAWATYTEMIIESASARERGRGMSIQLRMRQIRRVGAVAPSVDPPPGVAEGRTPVVTSGEVRTTPLPVSRDRLQEAERRSTIKAGVEIETPSIREEATNAAEQARYIPQNDINTGVGNTIDDTLAKAQTQASKKGRFAKIRKMVPNGKDIRNIVNQRVIPGVFNVGIFHQNRLAGFAARRMRIRINKTLGPLRDIGVTPPFLQGRQLTSTFGSLAPKKATNGWRPTI